MLARPRKLDIYRSTVAGVADLLNPAAVVDDGVIVGKNGCLMAAWAYEGRDHASSTDEQKEAVSIRINQALSRLGSGWMLHVDSIRRPAPEYPARGLSHFPDPVTAAMDEERRRLFERLGTLYEGGFVLTVTWLPPILAQKRFVALMFDDDSLAPDRHAQTRELIQSFQRECGVLESRLSLSLKLQRLKSRTVVNEDGTSLTYDDFLSHIQFCVTGLTHPVVLPSLPIYLDAVIGGQELWTGTVPKIGRHFIQCVAIEGFPMESYPGILSSLSELPVACRWSSRFIAMDAHEAVAAMDQYRKKWKQKVRGLFDQVFNTGHGHVDQDAVLMVDDAETAMAEVNSGLVALGYYTSVVVLMDEDRSAVEAAARQIEKSINALGFVARVETINTLEAFMGSLPGHGVENVRRPLINTLNLADLIPTSTIWTGERQAPCPMYPPGAPPLLHCVTNGRTPFRLNLHVRDLGHTMIFGPVGAGKSTLLGTLAQAFQRYPDMNVFAFDKGMSMYTLTKAAGGQHTIVAGDEEPLAFCPLQFLQTPGDRAWAGEWIETLLALNQVVISPAQRNAIAETLLRMHQNGDRTLSAFCFSIQDQPIREALKPYTVEGAMGHLLDADRDGLALNRLTVFEIEDLMNLGERYALPVLLYLFRRIERSIQGQPAAILLDEAWVMLGHPVFREKIREWLKVMRKANCAVVMATQSLTDAANSGILDVIVESTATKIFLPNLYARDPDTAALYARMGLNPRQIDILATAVPKRDYYTVSEKGRRLFDLALGPLALAFVGVSDKDSVAAVRQLVKTYGAKWVNEWLRSRNLNLEDYA
jgi:type IV secretion system protein VirB4